MSSDAISQTLNLTTTNLKDTSKTSVTEVSASPSPVEERRKHRFQHTENQLNMITSNAQYAAQYQETYKNGPLPLPPSKQYLVLTCMDARLDPAAMLGIPLGTAHIIRNAGACVADSLRSIVISQQLLGTKEIIVIKHTGCGMLLFDTPTAIGLVEKNLGADAKKELPEFVKGGEFLTYTNLEEAVEKDVQMLRDTKLVSNEIVISGWIYEVETGLVRQVV